MLTRQAGDCRQIGQPSGHQLASEHLHLSILGRRSSNSDDISLQKKQANLDVPLRSKWSGSLRQRSRAVVATRTLVVQLIKRTVAGTLSHVRTTVLAGFLKKRSLRCSHAFPQHVYIRESKLEPLIRQLESVAKFRNPFKIA